jgi:hypothetical protein
MKRGLEEEKDDKALKEARDKAQIKKNPWLHAWSDPIAGIHCYSQNMLL